MVAMTVSLLLIVVLLRVFTAATTSWQRGEAQADAYREARGALQIMARDLSTTVQPLVTGLDGAPLAPTLPTLVLSRYTDGNSKAGGRPFNEEVYCLSNIINNPAPPGLTNKDQGMNSELCSVGFFCQWMPDIASDAAKPRTPRAFALMRQFLDSRGVSKRLQSNQGANTPLRFDQLYARESLVPGSSVPQELRPATSTQLAAYIWDLKFRIDTTLIATEDGEAAASDQGDSSKSATPYDHTLPKPRIYDGRNIPYPSVLPTYVEIRFKALSTGAGRRLEGNNGVSEVDWQPLKAEEKPTSTYKQIILPNARQFVLRVPLLSSNPLSQSPAP